ncbi:unnamed protein product, partial [Mesorhabditis spiculigera]
MSSSSRGPLIVWACLPDQPDLSNVYNVLAQIGCDNISFVTDIGRIAHLPREDSPLMGEKEQGEKENEQQNGSHRPASSHTVSFSDSSCSRSITPPSCTTATTLPDREPSPIKSEPSDDGAEDDELAIGSPTMDDDDEPEREQPQMNLNLTAIANYLGQAHMLSALTPPKDEPVTEAGTSVDLSFLRNVPSADGKDKCVTCQICEKSFSRNARNVSRHAATHFPRAAARYTCGKCGEAFGRNDRAKYHVDTKHGGRAELHDKAKDSEYSDEWVKAVKQCFPGFDFSPRDTHTRNSLSDPESVPLSLTPMPNPLSVTQLVPTVATPAETMTTKIGCGLCAWTMFPTSPTSFAIEHAATHCPTLFTCDQCGEQGDAKADMEAHVSQRHNGNGRLIDSSVKGDQRLKELAIMCFPSRADDMDKAFEERARTVSKRRRIDTLFETKKKAKVV